MVQCDTTLGGGERRGEEGRERERETESIVLSHFRGWNEVHHDDAGRKRQKRIVWEE